MKWFNVTMIFLATTTSLYASNRFDEMETYKEIQKIAQIEGRKDEALSLIDGLMPKLDKSDSLYSELSDMKISLNGKNIAFPLEKAIKFATGTKEEYYCKDKGLVYLKAKHNDGTVSELKLITSNRILEKGSYSLVRKGDWIYELDTEYREPIVSDSWMDESTDSSYRMREVRSNSHDSGRWSAEWHGNSHNNNFSTRGNTPEPLPMHLGNDYHLWGAYDLGFRLKFELGYKDAISNKESGSEKVIILKTKREVAEKLATFSYQDSKGVNFKYSSCYKVVSQIELDQLQDR